MSICKQVFFRTYPFAPCQIPDKLSVPASLAELPQHLYVNPVCPESLFHPVVLSLIEKADNADVALSAHVTIRFR